MRRPLFFVAGAAAAVLVAAVGASAHTGFPLKFASVSHSHTGDEASGARMESPEPSESPEASPKPEPSEKPKPSPKVEPAEKPETEASDESGVDGAESSSSNVTSEDVGEHHGADQTGGGTGGGD